MDHPGLFIGKSAVLGAAVAGLWMLAMIPRLARAADSAAPEPRVYKNAHGRMMPYLLLKPKDYDPAKKYPLVMFYHGAGERGNDNQIQWRNGIEVFQTSENRQKYPCFVVAPQCPVNKQWVNVPWGNDSDPQPAEPSRSLQLSLEILHSLQKDFSIDADRLYVMGLSMGGFATWDVITRYPNLFAAAVPICGGGDEKQAPKIAHLPIWCFHGSIDSVVKPMRSRNMVKAIEKAGGHPKYTEYPGVGHPSWTPAFHEPELLPWMFGMHKDVKRKT